MQQEKNEIRCEEKRRLKWNTKCILCLIPSFAGITVFFLVPFVRMVYYSLISDQFRRKFIGFRNYANILHNSYFRLAVKNSLLLIVIAVPILILLAMVLSFALSFSLKSHPFLQNAFIFPMFVPTAAVVLAWQRLFSWADSPVPLYLLFIWKNIGICIILLTSALVSVDPEIYEAARIDGAEWVYIHRKISIPMIAPAIFFTVLLSIMNSFKIFKESYLYYGSKYPPDYAYSLQFYLNNNFLKFNYQKLAASSVLTVIFVMVIVGTGFHMQRRYER